MLDYTELIKQLRNRRVCIQATGGLDDYDLFRKAADAIEAQQIMIQGLNAIIIEYANRDDAPLGGFHDA